MTTPATQIFSFVATIPPQTILPDTFVQDCSFPDAQVVGIRWRVPPGPSGTMGFAITSDGANVIPAQQGMFIVADDESADWAVAGYQDSGSWQVTGYNNDTWPHSVYLDFLTVPVPLPGTAITAPLDATSLAPVPAAEDMSAGASLITGAPDTDASQSEIDALAAAEGGAG